MRKAIRKKRIILWCVLAAFCLIFQPVHAQADTQQKNTLTIEKTGRDMYFSLYQVAQRDGDGNYSWVHEFDNVVDMDVEQIFSDETAAAERIAETVDQQLPEGLQPVLKDVFVGADGKVVLSDHLEDGIYLLRGTSSDGKASAAPLLIALPHTLEDGTVSHEWVLDSAKVKVREKPDQLKVTKLWSGDTSSDRPKEVHVDIQKRSADNSIVQKIDDVVLSDENGWTYSWKDENPQEQGEWKVSEQKVSSGENNNSGYTVTIVKADSSENGSSAVTFQIKNTKKSPGNRSSKGSHKSIAGKVKTGDTMNLWLPVVFLVMAGGLALLLGWKFYRDNMETKR